MLTSILVTSLLATFAVAQSSATATASSSSAETSSGSSSGGGNSSSFDASQVGLTQKNQWCQGEQASCPMLCGGTTAQNGNTCVGSTLKFTCLCPNGSEPANIGDYVGTLPNFICEATFAQCRQNNPGSSACVTCGTLQPSTVPSATSAAPSSSGSAAAATSSGTESASAAGTTPSKGAAADNARPVGVGAGGAAVLGGVIAGLLL